MGKYKKHFKQDEWKSKLINQMNEKFFYAPPRKFLWRHIIDKKNWTEGTICAKNAEEALAKVGGSGEIYGEKN